MPEQTEQRNRLRELVANERSSRAGPPTSGEEGTDHEAEADGGHSKDEQEDEDQRGITVGQHRTVGAHLQQQRTFSQTLTF